MKVRDLLQALQSTDPELEVVVPDFHGGFISPQAPTKGVIEAGDLSENVLLISPPFGRAVRKGDDAGRLVTEALDVASRDEGCKHTPHTPPFDEAAAEGLSEVEVEMKWPCYVGLCADCGQAVILYASRRHFEMSGSTFSTWLPQQHPIFRGGESLSAPSDDT